MKPTREQLLLVAKALLKAPYVWWAKGDEMGKMEGKKALRVPTSQLCFDCSGFGLYVLKACGGPDLRFAFNTDSLLRLLPSIEEKDLALFDAVLYGPSPTDADHVMWYIGGGKVIGASGGDSGTTEPVQGKCVKIAPLRYRRDIIGFRSISEFIAD